VFGAHQFTQADQHHVVGLPYLIFTVAQFDAGDGEKGVCLKFAHVGDHVVIGDGQKVKTCRLVRCRALCRR
jgi:hypothetical protein